MDCGTPFDGIPLFIAHDKGDTVPKEDATPRFLGTAKKYFLSLCHSFNDLL